MRSFLLPDPGTNIWSGSEYLAFIWVFRCSIVPVVAEIDRIARPGGKLIVRDEPAVTKEIESLLKSLHWAVNSTFSDENIGILVAEKSYWRPQKFSSSS
ncbi:putative methyltransferase PMT27 [Platanthera guangdongensis]|uniref:Methyltransferase n=1 Tax=Platanthera guangdongensis TaxID=2320717 RepID=A0ABR2MLZ7_9ASPA